MVSFRAFSSELQKLAAPAAAIGAGIGASLGVLHGTIKEIDRTDKDKPSKRLKRVALRTALMGVGGAGIGHVASKGIKSIADILSEAMDRGVKSGVKGATGEAARAVSKAVEEGVKKGTEGAVYRAFDQGFISKDFLSKFLKRMRR